MAGPNTGIYGHWGDYAATSDLPNVAASSVQTPVLNKGDLAAVGDKLYICKTPTAGAAVWEEVSTGAPAPGTIPFVYAYDNEVTFPNSTSTSYISAPDTQVLVDFSFVAGIFTYTGATPFNALVTGGTNGADQVDANTQQIGFRNNNASFTPTLGVVTYATAVKLHAPMSPSILHTFNNGDTINMGGQQTGGVAQRMVGNWIRIEAV